MIYVVWVDDIIVVADSNKMMNYGKNILKNNFKMKDMGEISNFLGIKFKRYSDGSCSMEQGHYLESILEKYGMMSCKPRATPCEVKLSAYHSEDDEIGNESKYRAIVGSLIYAMTCTRPDLSWIVTKLSQHLSKPTVGDWAILKHVLRYVKGTLDYKLMFRKSGSNLRLVGFSDSDWASSEDDRRSTTGYYFSLSDVGPAISWKSRKQSTVALSSCEAEYMALTEATQEAIYLKQVYSDLVRESYDDPIQLYGDNQGSLALIKNPVRHNRTKHIDIRYHFIREHFLNNLIAVSYVETENNVADVMTKAMTQFKLRKFQKELFG